MPQSRINVMTLVTAMETGGLEVYLLSVLRAIDRDTFRVTIVCTGRDSNWYEAELDDLGVRTIFCPNPYSQIGYVRRIGRIMQERDIHVVCDFRGDFAAPTLWAARRRGIKSRIAMYRSASRLFRPDPLRNVYATLLHWGTRRWATRIIGNSRCVLDAFHPGWRSSAKFVVAYNGVDVHRFSPGRDGADVRREFGIPDDGLLIGHVGRFNAAKNHAVVLEAFAHLRSKVDRPYLLLVGDGGLRPRIEETISKLNLGGSVTLAGRRTDIPRMLSAMDVYLFPSIYEGHPNALIEAMACGLPVVASRIESVLETMPPDCDGDLFAPDDIAGMAGRLIHYCRDADRRATTGARLRRHVVEHLSLEDAVERLCSCWVRDL